MNVNMHFFGFLVDFLLNFNTRMGPRAPMFPPLSNYDKWITMYFCCEQHGMKISTYSPLP